MTHNFDNIALQIGNFSLHWYALMYVFSFIFIHYFLRKKNNSIKLITSEQLDNIFSFSIIGVIIGGRLGEVLFYNPSFYFNYPLEIFKVWKGGMSFHGGLIGVLLALYYCSYTYKIKFLNLTDLIVPFVPIGLFLGRLGNFINGELYGKACNYSWCMIFPLANDNITRHPSQLYQALLEGLFLFIIINIFLKKEKIGHATGVFLIGYAIARIIGELFRAPDSGIFSYFSFLSMGQWLSLPLLFIGLFFIVKSFNHKRT